MVDPTRLDAIMREAGALAMAHWPGAGHRVESWHKAGNEPVSAADLAVDAFLKRELGALLPQAGWLSEETADDRARLACEWVWVVDPIDGTRDFLRGRPGWCVSVALVRAGQVVLARLNAPAMGEEYAAALGAGARLNGGTIAVSGCADLAGARFPIETLARVDRMLVPVAKPNSIALRAAMVARGAADLLVTLRWGNEWDLAAAALVTAEAGAAVSDAFGRPLAFNAPTPRAFGLMVSAPAIHGAACHHFAERALEFAGRG